MKKQTIEWPEESLMENVVGFFWGSEPPHLK